MVPAERCLTCGQATLLVARLSVSFDSPLNMSCKGAAHKTLFIIMNALTWFFFTVVSRTPGFAMLTLT